MSGEGPFTHQARHQRKSVRTRARLMDAAVEVFARDGFEAASVNEIARRADVVNGTFYVHFKDKDAIAVEVAFKVAYDIARQIDGAMTHIDNAAERFSCATRQFIEIACGQPQWGWVLIRSAGYAPEVHRQVESYLRTDLERGVRQGLFDLEIDTFTVDAILSMILAALASRLRGDAGPEAASKVSEMVLRVLGVPAAAAKAFAWSPIELQGFKILTTPEADGVWVSDGAQT